MKLGDDFGLTQELRNVSPALMEQADSQVP
jgi:hypothetical protein